MLDLTGWVFDQVLQYPQKQCFVLGQQTENSTLMCLRFIIEANNLGRAHKDEALERLRQLNIELEMLRGFVAVADKMNFMTAKVAGRTIYKVDEIGKMCGGWIKALETGSEINRAVLEGLQADDEGLLESDDIV